MFNVAVVNIKDILKYLVNITTTLCLVMLVTRYFSSLSEDKSQQLDKKFSEVMQTTLLVCLDETIPGIKETNHELNNTDEDQINENDILGSLLRIELAMFNQEQKTADIQNTASNKTEEIEEDTQEEANIIEEVSRRSSNANCNRKSTSR